MLNELEIQSALMSLSDDLISSVSDACDRIIRRTNRPDARVACASIRLGTAIGAVSAATARNSSIGFVDLLTLVTLQRISLEEPWAVKTFDEEDRLLLHSTFAAAERKMWGRSDQVLTAQQQDELREMILTWRKDNPDKESLAFVRLQEFATVRQVSSGVPTSAGPTSIFSLLRIDPTANLAPATRQLQETRLLAERTKYWGQRLPLILGWQTELTSARLLNSNVAQEMLRSGSEATKTAGDISKTADRFATSYERMLDQFPKERNAAIEQIDRTVEVRVKALIEQSSAAVTSERTAAIKQLSEEYSKGMLSTVDRLGHEVDVQSGRSLDRMARIIADEREQMLSRLSAQLREADAASQRLIDRMAARLILVIVVGALAIACIAFVYRRIDARYSSTHGSRRDGNA